MALLTVYITNYNYGKYIRKAIESVFQQSFQDVELLIIDDGSTDNSKEIIEQYADRSNVRVIYQQNKGLNITNNIALQLANGRYIMRLDADDYLVADALEKMVNILEADPEIGLVFPDYYLVDHSTFTYLMAPGVGFLEFYPSDVSPDDMADSVECYSEAL